MPYSDILSKLEVTLSFICEVFVSALSDILLVDSSVLSAKPSIDSLAWSDASSVPIPSIFKNPFQASLTKLETESIILPSHSNFSPSAITTAINVPITTITSPIGLVKNANSAAAIFMTPTTTAINVPITTITSPIGLVNNAKTAAAILTTPTTSVDTLATTIAIATRPPITPIMTDITDMSCITHECVSMNETIHVVKLATTPTTAPITTDIT